MWLYLALGWVPPHTFNLHKTLSDLKPYGFYYNFSKKIPSLRPYTDFRLCAATCFQLT